MVAELTSVTAESAIGKHSVRNFKMNRVLGENSRQQMDGDFSSL